MGKWADTGYISNNLEFYTEKFNQAFKAAYGQDYVVDPQSPQGILIARLAELYFNADMDGVEGFARLNPNTATGVYLDLMGAQRGIVRSQGTPEIINVIITCPTTNFTVFTIPKDAVFTTLDGGTSFVAPNAITVTMPEFSTSLNYTTNGNSQVVIGTKLNTVGLSQIQDIEITNVVAGQPRESDMEYRTRIRREYPAAANTIEYVENKLLDSRLVRAVGHNYNDQNFEQDGLQPFTTEWVAAPIEGANLDAFKQAVASIIVNNKVPSSGTDGNTTVETTDVFGSPKTVKFTIPEEVALQIKVTVSTPETTQFLNLENVSSIAATMAEYVKTLGIGDDVSFSRIMAPLTADTGFDVGQVVMTQKGTTNSHTNASFPIGRRQFATLQESDITIGV